MDSEVLIDNEYVTLYYHPAEKIVHHVFHKFARGKPVREAFQAGSAALKEHGARKWLSDDRQCSVLTAEDLEWAQSVWEPEVVRNGWKYWAVVKPERAVIEMTTNELVARYESLGLTVQVFDEPEGAFDWLKSL